MKAPMADTSAQVCKNNGWVVGTRLAGDEGFGETVIEITAIGEESVLAKAISHGGVVNTFPRESSWVFWCRDWWVVQTGGVIG